MPAVAQHGFGRHGWVDVVARIATVFLHGNFKSISVVHGGVDALAIASQILVHTAAPQHRPRTAVVDCHLGGEHADSSRAFDKDRVGCEQRVVFLNHRRKLIEEGLALFQPTGRQVGGQASHRDVAVGQPRTACFLKEVENLFTLPKSVEKRTKCPQI